MGQQHLRQCSIPALETVGASHPYTFTIQPGGTAVWTFDNIMLPDSTVDFEGSQGYVMFTLMAKSSLVTGDTIRNEAAIYFDFNSPVITNTAKTAIVDIITGTQVFEDNDELLLFPNPSAGELNVVFTSEESSSMQLKLINMSGQVIYAENLSCFSGSFRKILDMSDVPDGVYFVQVLTEKTTNLKKIVLIR